MRNRKSGASRSPPPPATAGAGPDGTGEARVMGWRAAAGGWHMGIMNFGTIPDSHLTIDLAESVGLAAYSSRWLPWQASPLASPSFGQSAAG